MPKYNEFTEDLGSRLTGLIQRVQTFQTDAIHAVRERIGSYLPELPTHRLLEDLPKPKQVARANFALAEQLLRAQRSYTLGLLDAFQQPVEGAKEQRPSRNAEPKKDRSGGPIDSVDLNNVSA